MPSTAGRCGRGVHAAHLACFKPLTLYSFRYEDYWSQGRCFPNPRNWDLHAPVDVEWFFFSEFQCCLSCSLSSPRRTCKRGCRTRGDSIPSPARNSTTTLDKGPAFSKGFSQEWLPKWDVDKRERRSDVKDRNRERKSNSRALHSPPASLLNNWSGRPAWKRRRRTVISRSILDCSPKTAEE